MAVARRRGVRAAADLPRIRRFFSERPRPTAAILTGFSHSTGNLAQSRENPFPSPRAAPAPRGGWRRAAGGAGLARGAERARCQVGILIEPAERARAPPPVPEAEGAATRSALREHVRQEGAFPTRGIPLMRVCSVEDASPPAAAETVVKIDTKWEEAFMRQAGHLLKPSCMIVFKP